MALWHHTTMSGEATTNPRAVLTGPMLRKMLATAATWLERNAASIDAINVFPVPDGDTGRNMLMTIRASVEAVEALPEDAPLATVMAAAAHGALLGARGNSGVILSQWLGGMAEGCAGAEAADGALLASALGQAADSAYSAIAKPREGTILSVARALAGDGCAGDVRAVTAAALERAQEAVERTPEQMPLLAEAGVVDAGGQGLAVLLEGMLYGLEGRELPRSVDGSGEIDPEWLAAAKTDAADYGYCTEFVVAGDGIDIEEARRALEPLGDSLLVVGDASLLHVHVHARDPEAAFEIGARLGTVERLKAEDISRDYERLLGRSGRAEGFALVAVASGDGFEALFRSLGVAVIVPGGATQNPSAEEIVAAARSTHAADVLVLANDRNVIPAAEQAATLSDPVRLHIIPTTSMPAAVAALTAVEHNADVDDARRRMADAATGLATGAVTRAARTVERPVPLREGQPFALFDGEILGGAESVEDALSLLAGRIMKARPAAELLTVYRGADVSEAAAERARKRLATELPATVDVELVIGGQPHYPFLVSLE
ncbi:MAG: DAK2 domain-containing protein [Dehalococcoidia bacterium]